MKVIKKPKSTQTKASEEAQEPPKTRLNPFTGELETVQPTKKKASSSKQTALEKMLARAEAGPSISSKGKAKASDGLGGALKKKSRRHMSQQEKEEEDEIRWLEYSLGKSRQGEDVVRDDLDDFLDDLDRFQVGMYDGSSEDEDESDQEEVGESEDSGLEEVSASESEEESEEERDEEVSEEDESEVEAEEELRDGMDEEGMYDFDSNDEDDFSNWDAAMATTDEETEAEDDEEEDSDEESEELDSEAEEARALISGTATATTSSSSSPALAPSPAAQTTATKYIPPALRAKLAAESSSSTTAPSTSASASSGPGVTETEMDPLAAQKLRRQAQGLLNRLGDANIDTILTEYESLYRTHARAHVTSTITQLILDTITARSNLIDTFVILHAALVAALHKVVGVEFAAYFITRLVEELTKHYETLKKDSAKVEEGEEEGRGKECSGRFLPGFVLFVDED
ncbi:hypothetical protein NDA16_004923 [Ustilago loliicola]|nr:hypothetical protein NDA16_004923 [Ustilago loliicola]